MCIRDSLIQRLSKNGLKIIIGKREYLVANTDTQFAIQIKNRGQAKQVNEGQTCQISCGDGYIQRYRKHGSQRTNRTQSCSYRKVKSYVLGETHFRRG